MIYLNKEKLTEELNKTPMIAQHIDCMDLFDAINNSIAENVKEVVRCKDCAKQCTDNCLLYWNDINTPDNWYCADGVKR